MWNRWFTRDSYYSHGILVPVVSGYLIWQKQNELRAVHLRRSPWGFRLIILGILFYIISSMFRVYFTAGFSMLIVLWGLILHFYGPEVLRKILFPVFFLVFMMPLPSVAIVNISFNMKIFAAEIAERILTHMGLEAVRDGSLIKMQHAYVIVDDVCSGLRSLISLMALGSIFAYWMKGRVCKRLLLFATSIPIAVITNVCRVVLLASISEIWGPKYATGFTHDISGLLIFALAFIMLYIEGKLIE